MGISGKLVRSRLYSIYGMRTLRRTPNPVIMDCMEDAFTELESSYKRLLEESEGFSNDFYERPNNAYWLKGDCPKCNSAFSVSGGWCDQCGERVRRK